MRKTLLLTIMCMFAFLGNAQVTVEIGSDKNPRPDYNMPVYDYSKYSISQQLYFEEDFNDNFGEIKSISFKLANNVSPVTRKYEVYLKQVGDETFPITGFFQVTEDDKVFDGDVVISGVKDSWLTIALTKTFDYSGGNLMVCVYDKTGTAETVNYHKFYVYGVDSYRGMTNQGTNPYDMSNLQSVMGFGKQILNQIKFEMDGKPIVVVEPETIDLGETMLGGYWSEAEPFEVSVKAVSTKVTKIESDNAFFVVPAGLDYSSNLINFELGYNKNAAVDGVVNGNLIVTYDDGEVKIPMTANAYTPVKPDVYELAQEVVFDDKNSYKDTPDFTKLHDNYVLPRESKDGNAPDAVYAFELEEKSLIYAKVAGENAKVAIYDNTFSGNGGPSLDNDAKGELEITSEFFYDFNDGFMIDWVVKNYDNDEYGWSNTFAEYGTMGTYGVDNTYCIISYSTKYGTSILSCNNVIMTERPYTITANSVLSFDAKTFDTDHLKVEITKDGENYTFIKEIIPTTTYQSYEINLGSEFASLGLEYGDYHIALRHQENNKMSVLVDNIRLTKSSKTRTVATEDVIYAVPYPAGKYYMVAAAEGQFDVELVIINSDELPLAPENVTATTIDEFSIELEWDAAENATSYNIYRNDEFLTNVTGTSYVDENLTPFADYCYIVRGYNDIMESVPSEKACAKTDKLVLDYPEKVSAKSVSTTSIVLSWSPVEKAAGYYIYWGEDVIGQTSDTTYTVEDLNPSTEYCYNIASFNKNVESYEKSDFACATTNALTPAIPSNVKAEATSESSIKLTWDIAENATSYNVYYNGELLKGNIRTRQYNIINLEPNTEYCYTVSSSNGDVESDQCEPVCTSTLGDGIEEIISSFNVYPNPVNDKLFIETEVEIEEVIVYTITGVIVGQQSIVNSQQSTIDVTNLNSGIYFVKVVTENGEVVKRIIKD